MQAQPAYCLEDFRHNKPHSHTEYLLILPRACGRRRRTIIWKRSGLNYRLF
jgi:hypothetical protein